MSTLSQLCLRTPHKSPRNRSKAPDLSGCPQRRAQCLKVTVRKPKKPNSAQRKIARVQLSRGGKRI
jgi:small subunit ribosomal protein S12